MNNFTHAGPTVPPTVLHQGNVRALFRVYLILLTPVIVFVGGMCVKQYARLKLLRGQPVPLSATTGWTSGASLGNLCWKLRTIPGGWLGLLMILTSISNLVTDLGVAQGLNLVPGVSSNTVESGMIVSSKGQIVKYPDPAQAAATVALNAQYISWANANRTGLAGSHYAIYKFAPLDPSFMAQTSDIIGYWTCRNTTNDTGIVYNKYQGNETELYDESIWTDLMQKDLLYSGGASANVSLQDSYGISYGPSKHTLLMSSNQTVSTNGSIMTTYYDLKVAVGVSDATDDSGTKTVKTWHCELRTKDEAQTTWVVAANIDMDKVLQDWIQVISGGMWPGLFSSVAYSDDDLRTNLQRYLNAIIMVAGAGESINTPNTNPPLYYSIVQDVTVIPYWVISFCVLTFLWFCALTTLTIVFWTANKALSLQYDSNAAHSPRVTSKEIIDNTPIGLLDWIAHAAYESRDVDVFPDAKDLKHWIISTCWHGQRRLGIVKKTEFGQVQPGKAEAGYFSPGANGTAQEQMMPLYPMGKEQYTVVQSREIY